VPSLLFADFCEGGFEHKETLQTGADAAFKGGYTDICLVPNLNPITDTKAQVHYLTSQKLPVRIHPLGAMSKSCDGKQLSEMIDMREAGAIAFTDGYNSSQHTGLFLKALQYVKAFDGIIIYIPIDTDIAPHALMHEGEISTQLGMPGQPALAEHLAVKKAIELLRYTHSRLHLTGISSQASLEYIHQAKKEGLQLTCSVSPFHLLFTDEDLMTYDSNFKMYPPLRTQADRTALINGLQEGIIDCIASHHRPQDWDAKQKEFEYAKAGNISLQTMLPMILKAIPDVEPEKIAEWLSWTPAKILQLPQPNIEINEPAKLTVFSIHDTWMYNADINASLSENSTLLGEQLTGKIIATIHGEFSYIHA
jgi:Dihydroorotase and related cyclic amidohydrolases